MRLICASPRAALIAGGLTGLTLLSVLVPSCGGCTKMGCRPHTTLSVHLQAVPDTLFRGTITACWNGQCGSTTPLPKERRVGEDGVGPYVYFSGDLRASGLVTELEDGWTRLDIAVALYAVGPPEPPPRFPADGDRFRVAAVRADGTSLIDVERGALYETYYPNGKSCDDGEGCKEAVLKLYASSPAGLTCSGIKCVSGVQFFKTINHDPAAKAATLRVCRNDRCNESRIGLDRTSGGGGGIIGGPLEGSMSYSNSDDEHELRVMVAGNPATLADGDRYTLSIVDDRGRSLANVDERVTYVASFPNGQACDVHPCRTFRIDVP